MTLQDGWQLWLTYVLHLPKEYSVLNAFNTDLIEFWLNAYFGYKTFNLKINNFSSVSPREEVEKGECSTLD
jgi:hypothetical protein